MFGVTTPCVTAVRGLLEAAGCDVTVFHATGSGGRAMEGLIDDGYFAGVLDVTTTEWCDEVVGGVLTAGPTRLSAAGRRGIPQVVSVGALDMVNFGGIETVPERFRARNLYRHNATVTLMRTTADECVEIGRRIADPAERRDRTDRARAAPARCQRHRRPRPAVPRSGGESGPLRQPAHACRPARAGDRGRRAHQRPHVRACAGRHVPGAAATCRRRPSGSTPRD